jgi:hypothetical protein
MVYADFAKAKADCEINGQLVQENVEIELFSQNLYQKNVTAMLSELSYSKFVCKAQFEGELKETETGKKLRLKRTGFAIVPVQNDFDILISQKTRG